MDKCRSAGPASRCLNDSCRQWQQCWLKDYAIAEELSGDGGKEALGHEIEPDDLVANSVRRLSHDLQDDPNRLSAQVQDHFVMEITKLGVPNDDAITLVRVALAEPGKDGFGEEIENTVPLSEFILGLIKERAR